GICPLCHLSNSCADNSQNKLMEQMTSICEMVDQLIQKKQEEKQIQEDQVANTRYWKISAYYDNDDDYNFPIIPNETINSLNMGDKHLDTVSATKSDELIKSSVENLVPNPSESEGENSCDLPACFTTFSNILFDAEYEFDSTKSSFTSLNSLLEETNNFDDSLPEFTTFSNVLFDAEYEFDSSDDQSCSDEDVLEKIFSKPLFEEEIIPMKMDQHYYNAESDLMESLLIDLPRNDTLSIAEKESFHFDIPSFSRPPTKPPDDQIEDFSESNEEFSLTDDDSLSFDNIDYVEASPPDSELVSSEVMEIVIPEVGGIEASNDNPIPSYDSIISGNPPNLTPSEESDFFLETKSSSTSLNSLLEETNNFNNSLPEFTTFSKVLFDAECESDSSDDQSCFDEDVLEKIVLKPLCEEEIIPMKSLRTHVSSLPISSKIDSLLDEFAGELTLLKSISPGIDETDCDFEEDIRLIEKLLYDNSSPHPPE
nr:hypothetical protein [Tanacetum cinerariifolium]